MEVSFLLRNEAINLSGQISYVPPEPSQDRIHSSDVFRGNPRLLTKQAADLQTLSLALSYPHWCLFLNAKAYGSTFRQCRQRWAEC